MINDWDINIDLRNRLIAKAELLFSEKAYEKAIEIIARLAKIEGKYYLGYLSSIRSEILLQKIGQKLFPVSQYKTKTTTTRKVLHIATEFYNVGGHTRVALDWIKNDTKSISEILLVDQNAPFDLLEEDIIYKLKGATPIERAKQLRLFLEENYFDIIVLHQHMEDVVPTLALWDMKGKGGSKILFYNHSNFRLSLGSIIAHKRVNFCIGDVPLSEAYRYPLHECVLPFVLGENLPKPLTDAALNELKKRYSVENQLVFFSVGSVYKYRPFNDQNFFQEWNAFLEKHPNCALIVVGCTATDVKAYCPEIKLAPNLKLMGKVHHIESFYQVADYIVDIYPLQTGLGTLMGLYYGLPPILPYKENSMVIGNEANKLFPQGVVDYCSYRTQEAYFNFLAQELETGAYRKAAQPIIQQYVENNLLTAPWQEQLEIIYKEPVQEIDNVDKTKDVLITSKQSKEWYKYGEGASRSFDLIALAFESNVVFSVKLLKNYFSLILYFKKIRGSRLKQLFKYLMGKYS